MQENIIMECAPSIARVVATKRGLFVSYLMPEMPFSLLLETADTMTTQWDEKSSRCVDWTLGHVYKYSCILIEANHFTRDVSNAFKELEAVELASKASLDAGKWQSLVAILELRRSGSC